MGENALIGVGGTFFGSRETKGWTPHSRGAMRKTWASPAGRCRERLGHASC